MGILLTFLACIYFFLILLAAFFFSFSNCFSFALVCLIIPFLSLRFIRLNFFVMSLICFWWAGNDLIPSCSCPRASFGTPWWGTDLSQLRRCAVFHLEPFLSWARSFWDGSVPRQVYSWSEWSTNFSIILSFSCSFTLRSCNSSCAFSPIFPFFSAMSFSFVICFSALAS